MTTYGKPKKPLKNIPIHEKTVKGRIYLYQVVEAHRDKRSGQVVKVERYLGAKKPVARKIMEKMSDAEKSKCVNAWRGGEDVEAMQIRIQIYTGDKPSVPTIYNWFRAKGVTRAEKEKRTEKRKPVRAAETLRKKRQAQHRQKARESMESDGILISLIDDAVIALEL